MKRPLSLAVAVGIAVACGDHDVPTALPGNGPSLAIVDGRNDGARPGFFFLAPIRPITLDRTRTGPFDEYLSPVVEICEWTGTGCVLPLVSRLTMTDGPVLDRVYVFPGLEEYAVLWRTGNLGLSQNKTYRMRVLVGGTELGFADVDVVRTIRELLVVNRDEFVPLLSALILPIRFRIERGAVSVVGPDGGTVTVANGAASLVVPQGAVDEAVGITARQLTSFPDASHVIAGTVYDFGPDGLTFDPPATLTIGYQESSLPPGTDERNLRVVKFTDGAWRTVAGSSVDVSANTVTASVTSFSTYGVGLSSAATLVLRVQGGQGSVSIHDGVNPVTECSYQVSECTLTFPLGATVTLIAAGANNDMRFEEWTGTGSGFTCTTDPTCVVTMDQDRDVTARLSTPGLISVEPRTASFTMAQGGPASPGSAAVTVSAFGGRAVHLEDLRVAYAQGVPAWLHVEISSLVVGTSSPQTLTLSVVPNVLPPGDYDATVLVGDFAITLARVDVKLIVGPSVQYAFDGSGKQFGPLPLSTAIFTNATGTDIYPVGAGELYIFSLFDTGSDLVFVRSADAGVLGLGAASPGNPNQNTRVRLNGLSAIDPSTLFAPIQAHDATDGAQAEVFGIRVGPAAPPNRLDRPYTLIGAPVVNEVVARIDNTTTVTRGPYAFCNCSFQGPDITFYMPSDALPATGLQLSLERFGTTSPALLDNATRGQRYFIRDVLFRHGASAVMDHPAAAQQYRFLFDTGTQPTIINVRTATALGINLLAGGSFDCFAGPGNEGYVIDRIAFVGTASGGAGTYAVDHAAVCVDVRDEVIIIRYPSPSNPSVGIKVDAVIGANLFVHAPILFDGKDNKLGIVVP